MRFEAIMYGATVTGKTEEEVKDFFINDIKKKKNFLFRMEVEYIDDAAVKKAEILKKIEDDEINDRAE